MNKLLIAILLLLTLVGCRGKDEISEHYKLINDKNHVFEYTDAKSVINMLSTDSTEILVFVFEACPWCQEALPRINEVAKELNIDKVYLLDIYEMRNQKTEDYMTIFNRVKDHVEFTEGSLEAEKINVPNILVIKDGAIVDSHLATVATHQKVGGVLPPMTVEQADEYKSILRELLNKIK